MAIEHSSITDPQVHEPKGASSASEGTAYVSDGNGSGSWKTVWTPEDAQPKFAEMRIITGTSQVTLSAAVDPTLNTKSDYAKYTGDWQQGNSNGSVVIFDTDKLLITEDGFYQYDYFASVELIGGGAQNERFALKTSVDDTQLGLNDSKVIIQADFGGDIRNVSASGITSFEAGDSVSLWVAAESGVTVLINEAAMALRKVG